MVGRWRCTWASRCRHGAGSVCRRCLLAPSAGGTRSHGSARDRGCPDQRLDSGPRGHGARPDQLPGRGGNGALMRAVTREAGLDTKLTPALRMSGRSVERWRRAWRGSRQPGGRRRLSGMSRFSEVQIARLGCELGRGPLARPTDRGPALAFPSARLATSLPARPLFESLGAGQAGSA